jgi:hypothetical protein
VQTEIESELFRHSQAGARRMSYEDIGQRLARHLQDNDQLRSAIMGGWVTPADLVIFTPQELAANYTLGLDEI